jgi:hypothetical protein
MHNPPHTRAVESTVFDGSLLANRAAQGRPRPFTPSTDFDMTQRTIQGHLIHFFTVSGTVLDTQKTSTTRIHASQGLGVTDGQGHRPGALSMGSSTTVQSDIWIQSPDGQEHCIELTDSVAKLRPGNEVSFVILEREGSPFWTYGTVVNHSLRQSWLAHPVADLPQKLGLDISLSRTQFWLVLGAIVTLSYLFGGNGIAWLVPMVVGLMASAGLFVAAHHWRGSNVQSALTQEINAYTQQVLASRP